MPTADGGSLAHYNWFVNEFWRFVFVPKVVAEAAQTRIDFLPMQRGGSFNLNEVRERAVTGSR